MGSSKWPYQELAQNLTSLSDEGLTREMSALETRYDGQFTLASQLIKPNYLCYLQFGSIKRNNASFFTVLCSITICYLSKEFLLTDPEKMLHEFNILVKKIRKIVNFNLSRRKKEKFYWFCPSCVTSLSPPPLPKPGFRPLLIILLHLHAQHFRFDTTLPSGIVLLCFTTELERTRLL